MEGKKVEMECRNCHERMTIDYSTDRFSTQIQIFNGKKQQKRTYIKECPHCHTINSVTSEKKEEWGNRKGPNFKLFMFSGLFGCIGFIVIGILLLYFAFKGFGFVVDWLFN